MHWFLESLILGKDPSIEFAQRLKTTTTTVLNICTRQESACNTL